MFLAGTFVGMWFGSFVTAIILAIFMGGSRGDNDGNN